MTLKQLLQQFKMQTGFSDQHIANNIGVSRATIHRWANQDNIKLPEEMYERLSAYMNVDVEELLKEGFYMPQKPILGYTKAGYDMFLDENYIGNIKVNSEDDKAGDFFLIVSGDSMEGSKIFDGDLIYVKKTSEVNNNEIAIVQVGDEVTVKKFIKKDDLIILEASNPRYENRYFSKEEIRDLPVRVLGKVLYSRSEM